MRRVLTHCVAMAAVAVALTLSLNHTAFTASSLGEREGTCANAAILFPDNNPGPGSLKRIPVPDRRA